MKKLLTSALACAMALSLAGCGSSSSGSSSSSASGDTYIIATDTTFAPFEFQDESGNMVGIDMDLMNAIAEDQGLSIEIKSVGFDSAMTGVESGEYAGMIAGMSITDERKEKYDFSDSYFTSGVSMVVADTNYKTMEDLKGQTVVAKTSTSGWTYADANADEYGYTLKVVKSSDIMYTELNTGSVVALFEDTPVAKYSVKSNGYDFTVYDTIDSTSCEYGFAVKKGENAELLEKFNAGLANLKENGKYDEILAEYGIE